MNKKHLVGFFGLVVFLGATFYLFSINKNKILTPKKYKIGDTITMNEESLKCSTSLIGNSDRIVSVCKQDEKKFVIVSQNCVDMFLLAADSNRIVGILDFDLPINEFKTLIGECSSNKHNILASGNEEKTTNFESLQSKKLIVAVSKHDQLHLLKAWVINITDDSITEVSTDDVSCSEAVL